MKVSELTGTMLDYWVAKAEGYEAEIITDEKGPFVVRTEKFPMGGFTRGPFFPSTQWHDGGPIIEREKIDLAFQGTECCAGYNSRIESSGYDESLVEWIEMDFKQFGPTPLIAAMRAYVACKFRETVEDI